MTRKLHLLVGGLSLALGLAADSALQAQQRIVVCPPSSGVPVSQMNGGSSNVTYSSGTPGLLMSNQAAAPAGAGAPAGAAPSTPQAPARPGQDALTQAPSAFNEAAPAGTEGPGGYAPQMMGDSIVGFTLGSFSVLPSSNSRRSDLDTLVPLAALSGSAFKIADNEGPRPEDRIYLNVNHFTGVFHALQPVGFPRLRLTREVFGFEKTFLDGDASIGMRVPFFQLHASDGVNNISDVGNMTIVTKLVLASNDDRSSLVTGGISVTLPTGPNVPIFVVPAVDLGGILVPGAPVQVDSINPTIIQPYAAFLTGGEDTYIHGFSSLAFSMDDSFPSIWFNDIGVGYYAYRGADTTIIPTIEGHLTTPLSQDGAATFPVGVSHTLNVMLAAHLIGNDSGARFTLGWGFPVTGPQPFCNELTAQMNIPY